uniref:NADH-ubiquinone oxidoreductase chain 3 n=1 Tax=Schyzocotyle acheilognathi TaxID=135513 RepID=A0A172WXR3_SCHAC|nr:NADH dehydrogenase subunit 3 [Schyzocotyle acheilognathi]ANF28207.1 NADH dehydrogenase subunit 3 [Schyzocotyle acheilognathi]
MLVLFGGLVFVALLFMIVFFTSGYFNKIGLVVSSWSSPYECGFCSNSLSFDCFSFTYFSLLVFFVVFDLEISLLLNLPEQGLLHDNFIYYFCFLIILVFGFLAEIGFGYVRWGY